MKLTTFLKHTVWVTVLTAATVTQAQVRDLQALVRNVAGTATYSIEGQPALPVRNGARLPAGVTVRTGLASSVDLFLGRSTGTVRLGENTVLGIEKLQVNDLSSEAVTETELNLTEGEILGAANRLSSGSHYEIKVPTGILGIRGTRFRVRVPGGIAILDGTGVFVRNGQANVIKGPGQYLFDDGAGVQPLPESEIIPLRDQFRTLGVPGQNQGQNPIEARQLPKPPPQELPLSQVVGG